MMVAVTFWTLNPNLPPNKIAEAASKLMQKGLFPVKGVKEVLGFYITPGGRGVTITELEDGYDAAEVGFRDYVTWIREVPGLFASYESHPAVTAEKGIKITLETLK
jgi:hypothetical protein